MDINHQKEVLETLFKTSGEYIENRIELVKLKATKSIAEAVSEMVSKLVVVLIFSVFILVLNIGLGLWLGELLGKTYLGFLLLAGIYFIAGLIIYSGREKWFKIPVAESIIKKINQ